MKKILPFLIIGFTLSIIILFYNISRIPSGHEMGAILEAFSAIITTIVIFGITIGVSVYVSTLESDSQNYLQFSIYFLCVLLVSFASWKICISEERGKTYEEVREIQSNKLEKLISKGNRLIEKSDNIVPDIKTKAKDSISIMIFFTHFLDSAVISSSYKKDLSYHDVFSHFFNRNLTDSDSIESINCRKNILKNLSIDLMAYSPDRKFIFSILTYDINVNPTESNALALIGERKTGELILYKYRCFSNDYGVLNKKYAFYDLICNLKDKKSPCFKGSPLEKEFWTGRFFNKIDINGQEKYIYQVNELYNQGDKQFDDTDVPFIIVKEN